MGDTTSLIQALRGSTAGAAAPMTFFQPNYGAGQGMLADYSKPAGNMAFNPVRLYTPEYKPAAPVQAAQRGGLLSPQMLSFEQQGPGGEASPHTVPDPNLANALMALTPIGTFTTMMDIFSPMFGSQDGSNVPVVDMSVSADGVAGDTTSVAVANSGVGGW